VSHARPLPAISPRLVVALGLACAGLVGLLMARSPGQGVAATLALIFAPIALLNLPLGIALWVPLICLAELPFVWVGPTAASSVIFLAWLGTLRTQANGQVLRSHRRLVGAMVLYVLWVTLSVAWAQDASRTLEDMYVWYVSALVLVAVMTTLTTERQVRLIMGAFIFGLVLSVVVGLALTGLTPAQSALSSAAAVDGRLGGGSGDPNYLAAGLVPAIVLACTLAAVTRATLARLGLIVSVVILLIGLGATQSRGGLIAAAVAALAAVVVFKRQRPYVLALLFLLVTLAGAGLAATPGALTRVTTLDGGGDGRTDLWTVALRVWRDHPVLGVGHNNFTFQEQRYVRQPGQLTAVSLISEKPHVVHNVYLQALAELGVVGLGLLLLVLASSLAATRRAAHRFQATGRAELATLARGLLIAQIAILVALIFISDGADERFWLIFGLGPTLAGIAHAFPASAPIAAEESPRRRADGQPGISIRRREGPGPPSARPQGAPCSLERR